jgi:hypothetical protein
MAGLIGSVLAVEPGPVPLGVRLLVGHGPLYSLILIALATTIILLRALHRPGQ